MPYQSLTPMLMFVRNAEESMEFFASTFEGARIERIERFGEEELGSCRNGEAPMILTLGPIASPRSPAFPNTSVLRSFGLPRTLPE